jgi:hypothetical protein
VGHGRIGEWTRSSRKDLCLPIVLDHEPHEFGVVLIQSPTQFHSLCRFFESGEAVNAHYGTPTMEGVLNRESSPCPQICSQVRAIIRPIYLTLGAEKLRAFVVDTQAIFPVKPIAQTSGRFSGQDTLLVRDRELGSRSKGKPTENDHQRDRNSERGHLDFRIRFYA